MSLGEQLAFAASGGDRSWGTRGLGALGQSAANTLIAYSTAPGSVAADGGSGSGSNSPYKAALVSWLKQPIELSEVFRRVRDEVQQRTQGAQTPWETSSLGGKDFYLSGTR
ncbi:MAG: putative caspase-like protein [Planctomycetota bacterium]|jgi:uncharacterized caspase-like protein